MNKSNRLLGLILAVCLLISFIPAVSADETEGTALSYGPAVATGSDAVLTDSTLVYGDNQWLVLDDGKTTAGTAGVAFLSQNIVNANIPFQEGGLDNTWENSNAKAWLAQYAADAFTSDELSAILDTTKAEDAGNYFNGNWGADALNGEKLFFLSAGEVKEYFGESVEELVASADGLADGWWLRSANADRSISAGIVSDTGFVGSAHVSATWGARPAFNLSAENIVLSSSAVGGKVSDTVGADCLTPVSTTNANTWKLTVADDAHKSFTATIGDSEIISQNLGYDSWTLSVSYSGAVAGENEYVSVLLCNQLNEAIYYGHIAANSTSGTASINMPDGMNGKYTLYVFAEQCNGDNKTDYASPLVQYGIEIHDDLGDVDAWQLVLEGSVRADFRLELNETVTTDDSAYIRVKVDDEESRHMVSELVTDDMGRYSVSANIGVAQMTENIHIQIVTSEASGNEYIYSVRKYSDELMKISDDEKTIALVEAMLDYGARAQDYFRYNLDKPADRGVSVADVTIPYTEGTSARLSGKSSNVNFYGASLIQRLQSSVRFYFVATEQAIAGLTFTTADGQSVPYVKKSDNLYYVEISDISPQELCNDITVSVDGLSVTYSPFCYIHRMFYNQSNDASLRELMQAMYNYYHYANQYLSN